MSKELKEALCLLRIAQNELELLYYFALNHGIPEAGDPTHEQIKRFLAEVHNVPANRLAEGESSERRERT